MGRTCDMKAERDLVTTKPAVESPSWWRPVGQCLDSVRSEDAAGRAVARSPHCLL